MAVGSEAVPSPGVTLATDVRQVVHLDTSLMFRSASWQGRSSLFARRSMIGAALAIGLVVVLGAPMLPLRSHLSDATTAVVLVVPVVPVVVAVAVGGLVAGIVATVTGFLVFDLVLISPCCSLAVGAAQGWVALGVYAVVTIVIAQVAAHLGAARDEARLRTAEVRRLFDLS